jgi:hypothetical protein
VRKRRIDAEEEPVEWNAAKATEWRWTREKSVISSPMKFQDRFRSDVIEED